MFKLDIRDFTKSLVVAVMAAVLTALSTALNLPGFDFGTFDWANLLKIGIVAGLSYILKNFLSDETGKVFGRIG